MDSHKNEQWRALANTVMKKRVAVNTKTFFNGKETFYLSWRDIFCGVSEFVSLLNRCIPILSFLLMIH